MQCFSYSWFLFGKLDGAHDAVSNVNERLNKTLSLAMNAQSVKLFIQPKYLVVNKEKYLTNGCSAAPALRAYARQFVNSAFSESLRKVYRKCAAYKLRLNRTL